MFRIAKTYEFSASHQIEELPDDHKCRRLHGHNYKVEFTLQAEDLNDIGMVRDYGDFGPAWGAVGSLDHHHLNDLLVSTTAESIARTLFVDVVKYMPELISVRVSEGDHTWAEYSE